MVCSYVVLEGAQAELDSILSYLCELTGGTKAAKDLLDELEHQLALVCENPELYGLSHMTELAKLGYRTMLVKSYIALYAYRDNRIVVAHIFHQRQDYARLI